MFGKWKERGEQPGSKVFRPNVATEQPADELRAEVRRLGESLYFAEAKATTADRAAEAAKQDLVAAEIRAAAAERKLIEKDEAYRVFVSEQTVDLAKLKALLASQDQKIAALEAELAKATPVKVEFQWGAMELRGASPEDVAQDIVARMRRIVEGA